MKLSNTQKKLLKEIKKQKILFIDATEPQYLSAVDYLLDNDLIEKRKIITASFKDEEQSLNLNDFDLYIKLTQTGEAEVDNLLSSKLEKLNQWIPLLSLIVSFLAFYFGLS